MAASASLSLALASSTAASAGGTSSGRGAALSLWSCALAEASSASRTLSCAFEVAVVDPEEGVALLDVVALLDEHLDDHARARSTPIGMFSRRASISPAPAINRVGSSRAGRLDDRLREPAWGSPPGPTV